MIKINTSHIGPDGLALSGKEESDFLGLADVRDGKAAGPVSYNFHCSMAGRDLLVVGTASLPLKIECGRCLKESDFKLEVKSLCHHYENCSEKEIDISNAVREDLLLALPSNFHCSPKCKGLCPVCGADLNEGPCACSKKKKPEKGGKSDGESPWDALKGLKI
jgi:uncharacterized protein